MLTQRNSSLSLPDFSSTTEVIFMIKIFFDDSLYDSYTYIDQTYTYVLLVLHKPWPLSHIAKSFYLFFWVAMSPFCNEVVLFTII